MNKNTKIHILIGFIIAQACALGAQHKNQVSFWTQAYNKAEEAKSEIAQSKKHETHALIKSLQQDKTTATHTIPLIFNVASTDMKDTEDKIATLLAKVNELINQHKILDHDEMSINSWPAGRHNP
ncbi:MAG: hypothetical protein WAU01_07040 [Saprospiraceae bacterium]